MKLNTKYIILPKDGYNPIVVRQAHYDAWGVRLPLFGNPNPMQGRPEDRYKYNGKEFIASLGWYDYGARMYDPTIGRWGAVDPLAEKFPISTSYSYTVNNPVLLDDANGKDWSIDARRNKDGNWVITITVNAAIINNSGEEFNVGNYIKLQTQQFNRILSKTGEGFIVNANLNIREINDKSEAKKNEHLINVNNKKTFKNPDTEGGNSVYGGLNININRNFINADGTTDFNNVLTHEIGHTGGLKHPFESQDSDKFANRKKYSFGNQLNGSEKVYNFMSYAQDYYPQAYSAYNKVVWGIFKNPGKATRNQIASILRMYSNGALNYDDKQK